MTSYIPHNVDIGSLYTMTNEWDWSVTSEQKCV